MNGPTVTHISKYFRRLDRDVSVVETAKEIVKHATTESLAKISFGSINGESPSFTYGSEVVIQADEFELLEEFLSTVYIRRSTNRDIITDKGNELLEKAKELDGLLVRQT
jgi:hypothetical protein